jgi:MYXO-CTERM domain-containing protein
MTGRALAALLLLASCADRAAVTSSEQADTVCARGETISGMDVSSYEDSVDWATAHRAGIEFAFIRASDGTQYPDPKFAGYWAGARAAGVIRGAYQFFRPAEDPIAQADLLLQAMGPLQPGDLPPVLDVEVSGGQTQAQVRAAIRAWADHVAAAIGREPIIYAGLYSWADLTGGADFTSSPLWVAQYTSAACPDIPTPWTAWAFWQDTSTGSVEGVPGSGLDLDVFDGSRDDLLAFAAAGTCGDGTCSGGETVDSCPTDCPPCGTIGPGGGEIDDGDACFTAGGPAKYLRQVADAGEGGDLIWTHATDAAAEANFAQWDLYFARAGRYRVEAYTAHAYATSTRAAYTIEAAGSPAVATIDPSAVDGWHRLGDFDFAAGGGQSIHLGDNTGEPASANAQLVFDAVRLTRLDDTSPLPDHFHAGCTTTGGDGGLLVVLAALLARRRRRRC